MKTIYVQPNFINGSIFASDGSTPNAETLDDLIVRGLREENAAGAVRWRIFYMPDTIPQGSRSAGLRATFKNGVEVLLVFVGLHPQLLLEALSAIHTGGTTDEEKAFVGRVRGSFMSDFPGANLEEAPSIHGFTEVYTPSDKLKVQVGVSFKYHAPLKNQPIRYETLRNIANQLAGYLISAVPESRELSLALTKLEEAVMWANAGIARNEKEVIFDVTKEEIEAEVAKAKEQHVTPEIIREAE